MGNELWPGQAQNGVNSDFEVKFDLEGHGQLPPKIIGTLTKVFCIFGPNLAILAWKGLDVSHGQARDWHTDSHTHTGTHTQTQAMTYPKAKTGLRRLKLASGKNRSYMGYTIFKVLMFKFESLKYHNLSWDFIGHFI